MNLFPMGERTFKAREMVLPLYAATPMPKALVFDVCLTGCKSFIYL